MIACRYGTIPVVRETGGLYDSIKPLENGYTFANYNAHDMLYVIRQAMSDYKNKEEWKKLMYRAATTISVGTVRLKFTNLSIQIC